MHVELHYISTLVSTHWKVWLEWLISGGGVWLLTEIKKAFKDFESAKSAQRFVLVISALTWLADWFYKYYPLHFSTASNPIWVFPGAAGLFTIATFLHHTPLKKLTAAASNALNVDLKAFKLAKANYKAEVTAANSEKPLDPSVDDYKPSGNPFEDTK